MEGFLYVEKKGCLFVYSFKRQRSKGWILPKGRQVHELKETHVVLTIFKVIALCLSKALLTQKPAELLKKLTYN